MTWSVMADVPNPLFDENGDPFSGAVLKAYLPGTTTSTSIAIDKGGSSPQASITYNAEGKLEVSGNEILPHIDREHKWGIFANATDAAADTPFYMGPFDNVEKVAARSGTVKRFAVLNDAVTNTGLVDGDVLDIKERTSGNKGGGTWDVVLSSTVTENSYNIVQCTGVATLSLVLRVDHDYINAASCGAAYDDSSDDSDAIQAAIDLIGNTEGGGTVYITGPSRVTVTKGTNDKYGINIPYDNVRIKFGPKGSLRRQSSDISTYAKSFPILLIGTADSNDAADQVENVTICGKGKFIGEDTRHSSSGSALMDGRHAIWIKNADGVNIEKGVRFLDIDSGAIWIQKPGEFDYENSVYYNTTKAYNIRINGCKFKAQSHSTAGRALIHAVYARADDVEITNNYFEWCDDCANLSTTYDDYDDVETDTYTDSNIGTVKRAGRGFTISNNTFKNSSEHALYLNGMGITVGPNTTVVTDATTCNTTQYQIRGRGVSINGGTMTGVAQAGAINTGSMDVTWKGTVINAVGDSAGGAINIQSSGLTSHIDNRSDYFGSYKAMQNIRVDVTINMPEASQTNGVGIRLLTDTSDANFPEGQMINVNLSGTIINNAKKAILNIAPMAKNVAFDNMELNGKPFTSTDYGDQGTHDGSNNASTLTDSTQSWTTNDYVGWRVKNITDGSEGSITANTATTITATLSGGTDNDWDTNDVWQIVAPQNSLYALGVDDAFTAPLQEVSFTNNKIRGFQYILYDEGGAGANIYPPYGITDNTFDFIEYWDTAAFRAPSFESRFTGNTGRRFLDRDGWTSNTSINNSLSDGSSNSEKRTCIQLVSSSDVRIYYDDDNNFKAL